MSNWLQGWIYSWLTKNFFPKIPKKFPKSQKIPKIAYILFCLLPLGKIKLWSFHNKAKANQRETSRYREAKWSDSLKKPLFELWVEVLLISRENTSIGRHISFERRLPKGRRFCKSDIHSMSIQRCKRPPILKWKGEKLGQIWKLQDGSMESWMNLATFDRRI